MKEVIKLLFNKQKYWISSWIFGLIILLSFSALASGAIPEPVGYVNDFANVLNRQSEAEIEAIAKSLAEQQGIELAVVTLTSIEPETPEFYRLKLFEQWQIGGSEDSGLLILLVTESRDIQVEVGYGIEGVLPDGKVGAILDQFVIPHLARNDYDRGLVEAAKSYQAELIGESFLLESSHEQSGGDVPAFVVFLVMAIIVSIISRKSPPGDSDGGSGGTPGTRRRPVMYPTRLPRSGGGRSGGGFGGFGGGRSGGGGAGRKF